jgi:tRNA(Ile)-lysidine synthase TilS/MesJ
MLNCTKKNILDYLQKHNIDYYTDPTNRSDTYLRNRIRNHVIPTLQSTDLRFDQNLTSAMHHLAQVDDFLNQEVTQFLIKNSTQQGIDILLFLSLHIVLQQRIILQLIINEQIIFIPSQKLFKEIMRFLEKSSCNKHIINKFWIIQKNRSHFFIKKI